MLNRTHIDQINPFARKITRWARIYMQRQRLANIRKSKPHLFKPINKQIEKRHKQLWSPLNRSIDLSFLRFYCNRSGIEDYRYTPNDLFVACVERILNDANSASYDMDKNNLEKIVGKKGVAPCVFRRMAGVYLDADYAIINKNKVLEILKHNKSNLIIKPSRDTYGGSGVVKYFRKNQRYIDSKAQTFDLKKANAFYGEDYIVQECLDQHTFCKNFNPDSLNTIRVLTYRSITDEKIHILKNWFRIGMKGKCVDNVTAGGLHVHVDLDGNFYYTAKNIHNDSIVCHPEQNFKFKGIVFPFMDKVIEKAIKTALLFPRHRILGLDIAMSVDAEPILIEVNILGNYHDQTEDGPLFKELTEEVVDYCSKNPYKDNFQVLRV